MEHSIEKNLEKQVHQNVTLAEYRNQKVNCTNSTIVDQKDESKTYLDRFLKDRNNIHNKDKKEWLKSGRTDYKSDALSRNDSKEMIDYFKNNKENFGTKSQRIISTTKDKQSPDKLILKENLLRNNLVEEENAEQKGSIKQVLRELKSA